MRHGIRSEWLVSSHDCAMLLAHIHHESSSYNSDGEHSVCGLRPRIYHWSGIDIPNRILAHTTNTSDHAHHAH